METTTTTHAPPLNACQQRAYDDVMTYLQGGTDKVAWLVEGFAGTGKSFLVNRIVADLHRFNPALKIAFAAPTHPALEVLRAGNTVPTAHREREYGTQDIAPIMFFTSASALSLKMVVKDNGEEAFEEVPNGPPPPIAEIDVLFHDETSMLPLRYLKKTLRHAQNICVVFVGDGGQLPPIGEGPSPVFTSEAFREDWGVGRSVLDQPMRQKGDSPVLDLATAIREGTWNEQDLDDFCVDGSVERRDHKFLSSLLGRFRTEADFYRFRILTYTNDCVARWNLLAREAYFKAVLNSPPPLDGDPVAGERVLITKPLAGPGGSIIVNNGTLLSVKAVRRDRVRLEAASGHADVDVLELTCLTTSTAMEPEGRSILIVAEGDADVFARWCDDWKEAIMSRPKHMRSEGWRKFLGQRNRFARWQFAFASTTHKAQGGSFDAVAVLLEDYHTCRRVDPMNWRRLMYVGVTRARKLVYMVKG